MTQKIKKVQTKEQKIKNYTFFRDFSIGSTTACGVLLAHSFIWESFNKNSMIGKLLILALFGLVINYWMIKLLNKLEDSSSMEKENRK